MRLIHGNANPIINPHPSECLSTSLSCMYGVWTDYQVASTLILPPNNIKWFNDVLLRNSRGSGEKMHHFSSSFYSTGYLYPIAEWVGWQPHPTLSGAKVARIGPSFEKDGAWSRIKRTPHWASWSWEYSSWVTNTNLRNMSKYEESYPTAHKSRRIGPSLWGEE